MSLPTVEECQSALSNCLADSSPTDEAIQTWRRLIQRCLSHGTSFDDHLLTTSSSPDDADKNEEVLTSRAKEAGGILSDSIEWYLRQWWNQKQQNNDGSGHDNHNVSLEVQKQLKNDAVICAVVESLWLVGCLLDTEEESSADATKSNGDNETSNVPYQCLVNIIKDLSASRNWMTRSTDGKDAMETDENSQPLIPIVSLQTTLELSLLQSANLLPNPPPTTAKAKAMKARGGKGGAAAAADDTPVDFVHKKLKKINTDMYYRQHKFNLLAEESEGYAKLLSFFVVGINELGTSDKDGEDGVNDNSLSKAARRYVRELIGAFDLDPNRVLDLALDALEWELNEIMTSQQTKKSSSKSGVNEEWGFEAINTAMSNVQNPNVVNTLVAIIRELDGNSRTGRAIAHLLGFKYRSYNNRAAKIAAVAAEKEKDGKDATDKAGSGNGKSASAPTRIYPRSLFISTAFLCAHGLVDPHNLLPHLKSTLNLIDTYKTHTTNTIKRLKKLGVVSLNSSKADNKAAKEDTVENESADRDAAFQNDPVIGVFRAFLAMGEGDRSAAFLAHATVPEFDSAVKDGDGDKMFSAMELAVLAACSLSDSVGADLCAWVATKIKNVSNEENGNSDKSTSKSRASILPLLNSPFPSETPLSEISAVLRGPLSSLSASGAIRLAQSLYINLCRVYNKKLVLADSESEVDIKCIDDNTMSVLSTFIVPSLSLFPSDTLLPKELWSLLKKLPYTLRYDLYSAWRKPGLEKGTLRSMLPKDIKSGKIPKPLGNIESEIETGIAARYVLKRISKENIKDMGRQLSKTSHNNPLVVFTDILSKIESYDNLILMMVDTFQFATELSLDVMGYCLLLSLGGGDGGGQRRSGTKMGGLNTEQWLASLETFTGAFYKKFPDVELRGILIYLTARFRDGESSELGVLRSLIKTAGGYGFVDYDSTASLSELQLDGRCGSRLLKRETSSFGVVDNINRKASQHLRAVLQGDDLGVMMILLLSQMRLKILYTKAGSGTEHVKVIGNTYDDCEAVLCLLLEFLSDSSGDQVGSSTKEKFAASMPSLGDLHSKYGLDAAVAWMLCRPLIRKSMFFKDDSKLAGNASQNAMPDFLKRFAASPEMTTSCEKLLPQGAWKNLTPSMFQVFYSLSIYDILCPEERYNIEIGRLKKEVERLTILQKGGDAARGQMSALAAAAAAAGASANEVRQATAFTTVHREELDRLKRNVDQLNRDFQRQQKRCKFVMSMLESQKEDLIHSGESNGMFASAFMTFCIYPRCFLSPEDSLFCAQFIKVLHRMKLPGFMTIELIDNIVNAATGSLYCMTEDEAGNLAIFLNEIWKSVNSWRYNNDAFSTELKGSPGSKLSTEFAEANNIGDHSVTDGITHDDFKALYTQWHSKIGVSSIGCLASSEYMHTRAALIVLSRIVLVYPTQPKVGDKILKSLSSLQREDNPRPDIRATAQGYCSQLTKARDEGMWKEENIAVTRARQEKEKAKAEERKKNLALQHENMKKESEAITREIVDGGRYGRDRRDDRGRFDDRGRPWGADPMRRGPPMNASAPVFTPKVGVQRELGFVDRREHDRRGGGGGPERDVYVPPSRRDGPVTRRQEEGRGERRKRSRSPDRDDTEHQQSKRSRGEWAPPRRSARR